MSLNVRYPNKLGEIEEHFLLMVKVGDTCAETLFNAIKKALTDLGINVKKMRGQGMFTLFIICIVDVNFLHIFLYYFVYRV